MGHPIYLVIVMEGWVMGHPVYLVIVIEIQVMEHPAFHNNVNGSFLASRRAYTS